MNIIKEYTDLSSNPYVENSLESLRTAIDVTSIPTTDKHSIEQAVTNLQKVIAPSVNDHQVPISLATLREVC